MKLKNRFDDEAFAKRLPAALGIEEGRAVTWRTYNSILLRRPSHGEDGHDAPGGPHFRGGGREHFPLHARTVFERMEDIAVLKALGGVRPHGPERLRAGRTRNGAPGRHPRTRGRPGDRGQRERGLRGCGGPGQRVGALPERRPGGRRLRESQVFSPTYFYLVRIPTRVVSGRSCSSMLRGPPAAAAAWAASRRVLTFRPAEVLRNE
ncbi:MAG: hypothetical protein MZU97_12195 [Bacillus subtilis]|nr:hypothetical protein [Bacillus subtilis]